jgi:hypothetical protein
VTRSLPHRVVVIGDLHGAFKALQEILRGVGLVDRRLRWTGGRSVLVQAGDIFNRSDGGRASFDLLLRLRAEANGQGGDVTLLPGNHDVMMADGNEAYATPGEYLAFATARERARFERRSHRTLFRFHFERSTDGIIHPARPRHQAWMIENAPGKKAMRRAFGPRGKIGRELRRAPIAARAGDAVVVHAGLTARWAGLGLDGLNRAAAAAWAALDSGDRRAFRRSLLCHYWGPLWIRRFAASEGDAVERSLDAALARLGARRLVIGHTQTPSLPTGTRGSILTRFGGRVICVDVGMLDTDPSSWAALLVDRGGGREWKPSGERVVWKSR